CSSVNRLFFMTSFSPLEAILSSFNWSENSRAGQQRVTCGAQCRRDGIEFDEISARLVQP
ncbi:hypothetical protein, partial [Burkholderia pseudomallei]